MENQFALIGLLAVLLLAFAFQAFELAELKSGVAKIQSPGAVVPAPAALASSAPAGSLAGLPNMVGGC